jgi:2-haloacid dehalogenase
MRLSDFRALSFDCYGTLIDWEAGILQALEGFRARAGAIDDDALLAAFARAESEEQRASPGLLYPRLLGRVLERMGQALGVAVSGAEAEAFGASVGDWPAFPDSAEALAELKRHYRLIILSNVDRASFARSNERLGVAFDAIYTAEDIGSYKPDPRNFDWLVEHARADLGLRPAQILHTAESLFHDLLQAGRNGLATCWIHRRAAKGGFGATTPPSAPVEPDFRFTSLADMAQARSAEAAAG